MKSKVYSIMYDKPKILMVDDKPENLLVLERLLRELPVELYAVQSGNEALKLTLHHDFALALLDIQMPEMDGYELAELLRQEDRTADMPFIFISAIYTEHINIFRGYEKGAFSYIVKPFEPEILLNKVKLFIDMHNQKRELYRRTEELERSNRELEAFSYSVSHDLRAPLRAINGFSQALREEYESGLDDTARSYIERICNATARMGHLIDDLLDLSRVSRAELNAVEVDIGGLARETGDELRSAAPEREVELSIGEELFARADLHLLRVALQNLIGNAWKFTSENDVARITVDKLPETQPPVFYVRDDGVGFDMKYSKQLFAPFQRLHEARRFPGTGIGLATVQRIIHKHGGRIWAESEPGKGTTFYFTLARSPAPLSEGAAV